jgi:glycerol-3-phosphate dehydrogenase
MHDVVIIGGGVTGTSIARQLSKYRLDVVLLEKEEELAFGVSKSNSGIIHPGTQNPADSLKGRLCVLGNKLTRRMSMELGIDFKEVGELIVAFNEDERLKLVQIKEEAQRLGVPRLLMADRKWLDRNEPNLSKKAIAALYAPTAGIISPYRWVYDLSENAAANGVRIHTMTKVEGIVATAAKSFEVGTTKGVFKTRFVVNAAGLFADDISAMVGLKNFKITPRKGEEFLLDKKKENITNHLIFPLPSKDSKGVLVIKTSDGNPMIGPTAEDVRSKDDLSTSDEGFEKVLSSVKRLVPSISGDDVIAYFAGLRPASGGDFIIRHEYKMPGFINVAGIQSPGLTAAPAIALLVAEILKDNGLAMRRKLFFKKRRKKEVHLFNIPVKKTDSLIKRDPSYGDIVCRCELVSAKEVTDAISRGARTMDGIKFRTRAQAGRCHGSFCTTRLMKILAEKTGKNPTDITKRGKGSEVVMEDRAYG